MEILNDLDNIREKLVGKIPCDNREMILHRTQHLLRHLKN